MATYLLTWNPKRYPLEDEEWKERIRKIEKNGIYKGRWSCGVTKRICSDDRVFLIKLGKEPRGIIASGWATSEPYMDRHWNKQVGKKSTRTLYIDIHFDTILYPEKEILTLSSLKNNIDAKMNWTPRASGVSIPSDLSEKLEKVWAQFLNRPIICNKVFPDELDVSRTYNEGVKKKIVVNAYERNAEARIKCIQCYGLTCSVCGFNFEETYGEIGTGFIHVHHLKPLSEIGKEYQLNPITDLRPVCPNCHSMIHRREPGYTIDELKARLKHKKKKSC